MQDLTFGEQVKIILGRRGMTIKELAEMIEEKTGKKMSRQNLTQRLGRDNFQEQDMRMIAQILDCPFQLNIMEEEPDEAAVEAAAAPAPRKAKNRAAEEILAAGTKTAAPEAETGPEAETELEAAETLAAEAESMAAQLEDAVEREVTVGEFLDAEEAAQEETAQEMTAQEENAQQETAQKEAAAKTAKAKKTGQKKAAQSDTAWAEAVQAEAAQKREARKQAAKTAAGQADAPAEGEINPYTGKEYESNSVRMHPKRIGYVQVYDQDQHQWIDMTEWAFLGYEERKKALMGDKYVPPTYLD